MKTLTTEAAAKFLSKNPTLLFEFNNVLRQRVKLYEHPDLGEDAPVYACIEGIVANTYRGDFHDLLIEDYQPILAINDKIVSNT